LHGHVDGLLWTSQRVAPVGRTTCEVARNHSGNAGVSSMRFQMRASSSTIC
jgi:hypothetical protein